MKNTFDNIIENNNRAERLNSARYNNIKRDYTMRYILLMDGTGLDGITLKIKTDASKQELEQLEKQNDGTIWQDYFNSKGKIFEIEDEHENINQFGTALNYFRDIKEIYAIN